MDKPKLIVFDLNKTLIEENTWLNLNLAMGVTRAEDDILMAWGQEGIISDSEGQALLCSIYQTRGNPTRTNITEIISNYHYLPEAQETVKELREQGFTLALISGSIDLLVEHVATELGIQHWTSNNRFVFDDNDVLQKIETEDNDSVYKVNQLERLCNQIGIDVKEAMCVGDGDNDVALFETSGNGVTFNDSRYADKARQTIGSLKDLLNLVM